MGSFVDSAADYYSERATNSSRKKVWQKLWPVFALDQSESVAFCLFVSTLKTLVDTLLQDAKFRKRAKEKFIEIQKVLTFFNSRFPTLRFVLILRFCLRLKSREISHRRQKHPKRK